MDSNDIDELVEKQNQELTTEELTELHCVLHQEVIQESLSEEEEVTAKLQSSSAVREMLLADNGLVQIFLIFEIPSVFYGFGDLFGWRRDAATPGMIGNRDRGPRRVMVPPPLRILAIRKGQ
ncbi:hypothetical protein AVEN_35772-1 [Araneus ventricosus]|uniref:Uncharacterized protein n=1 Tax=Araneus ventricosus TaxID=182803 RepID=A0A4Y2NV42_ARAVE|nr:hypothetical protein AVEN_35772-1 [Araneus ventricosus]